MELFSGRRRRDACDRAAGYSSYRADCQARSGPLPRFIASWLIVLIVAPFTAPFRICDFTSLFGGEAGRHAPLVPPAAAALSVDAAVPSVPVVSSGGRSRLMPLFRVIPSLSEVPPSSSHFIGSAALAARSGAPAVRTTVLRL